MIHKQPRQIKQSGKPTDHKHDMQPLNPQKHTHPIIQLLARHPFIKRLVPSPVTALLLVAIIWLWFHPLANMTPSNRPVPNITLHLLDGRNIPLSSLRGQVVLINVWATWCPYCIKEMPEIRSFDHDWHARGFTVISLSMDDNPAKARDWLASHGYTFTAGMADAATQQAFGPIHQLPTSFLLDRQGHLRESINGQVYYGRLEKLVTPLVNSH